MRTAGGAMLLVLAAVASATAHMPKGRIVDLTHVFDAATIYWPTEEGFVLEKGHAETTEKGHWYASNRFSSAEHGGTHLDAPFHFWKDGQKLDEIPLDRLMGRAILVDVSKKAASDRDLRISVADFEQWEARHSKIPDGMIVLLRTGFGRFWPDRRKYLGTDERGEGAVAKLSFPGLHHEAAAWLVKERAVKAVGIDTASIDHGKSTLFETHVALFRENVPAFENLANLEQLPETGLLVVALPMKIRGGSGGPLRVVAVVEEESILPTE